MAGSISTLGLGSGLDLQGILEKLKAADTIPIANMEARQLQYKDQLAEYETVNGKCLALKNLAFDLTLNDTFDTREISSSREDIIQAEASSIASTGTYEITVTSLAKKNSWQSSGVSAPTSAIASSVGSFTYTVDGQQTSVDITASTTLQSLADAINEDANNPGVIAVVMDDGTGTDAFHLVLVSNETGEANAITIDTNDTDITLTEKQAAGTLNALVNINGIDYQRSNNSIDDILTGVTLNLTGTGIASVTTKADSSGVKEKLLELVTVYNETTQEIKTNSTYNPETGIGGSLFGANYFKSMVNTLNQMFTSPISGLDSQYTSLVDIGLTFERDGTLSFDETILDAALNDNIDDVKLLLIGDPEADVEGIAEKLNDQLQFITSPSTGLIASESGNIEQRIDQLDEDIEKANQRIDARYKILQMQFIELDKLMSSLQSQGSYLEGAFSNIEKMWGNE